MSKKARKGLVYSTDTGKMCPACGFGKQECRCSSGKSFPASDSIVRIHRQTKGRKGSGVSLVTGLSLPPDQLKQVAKKLKKTCGSGGTVKENTIEIQGDHRELIKELLQKMGYSVKIAGG